MGSGKEEGGKVEDREQSGEERMAEALRSVTPLFNTFLKPEVYMLTSMSLS